MWSGDAWVTRNCSVASVSRSKACLSCTSHDAIVSSAVVSSVYQRRVNLNSIFAGGSGLTLLLCPPDVLILLLRAP